MKCKKCGIGEARVVYVSCRGCEAKRQREYRAKVVQPKELAPWEKRLERREIDPETRKRLGIS